MISFTDTHTHLDGEEFVNDLPDVVQRAKDAGVARVLIPAIDLKNVDSVVELCHNYPGYAYPMIGLHPEEVKADWASVLHEMRKILDSNSDFIAIDVFAGKRIGTVLYDNQRFGNSAYRKTKRVL